MSNTFKPFHFEGNLGWGVINSPEDFERIVQNYQGVGGWPRDRTICIEHLLRATRNDKWERADGLPCFGFRREHIGGKQTLAEYWPEAVTQLEAEPVA